MNSLEDFDKLLKHYYTAERVAAMSNLRHPLLNLEPPTRWQRFRRKAKHVVLWPWRKVQRALRWAGGCTCDEDS